MFDWEYSWPTHKDKVKELYLTEYIPKHHEIDNDDLSITAVVAN